MDIADACCEHVHAQICDLLALIRVSALTHTYDTVFLAANGAYLCLNRKAKLMSHSNKFFCLCDILIDRIVRTVEHDWREACLDALVACVICAVIQMERYRNCDTEICIHCLNHRWNGIESCHIFAGTLWHTEDNRAV